MEHHIYAATHGDQFGNMEVSVYQGEPMHLFAYWQAVTDKKGQTVVIKSAHWAGAESPCDGYEILGEWDDEAEGRFEAERKKLMVEHDATDGPNREATVRLEKRPTPVTRVEPLEREDGQMRLF